MLVSCYRWPLFAAFIKLLGVAKIKPKYFYNCCFDELLILLYRQDFMQNSHCCELRGLLCLIDISLHITAWLASLKIKRSQQRWQTCHNVFYFPIGICWSVSPHTIQLHTVESFVTSGFIFSFIQPKHSVCNISTEILNLSCLLLGYEKIITIIIMEPVVIALVTIYCQCHPFFFSQSETIIPDAGKLVPLTCWLWKGTHWLCVCVCARAFVVQFPHLFRFVFVVHLPRVWS